MIAVYCWPHSAYPGEVVNIHAHGSDIGRVRITRIGHERTVVAEFENQQLSLQKIPSDAAYEGCDWAVLAAVETNFETGFYLVELSTQTETAEAFFVVKPTSTVDAMLVLSTSTWAAYNEWGGPSFYTGGHTSSLRRPLPRGFLTKENIHRFRLAHHQHWTRSDQTAFAAHGYSPWCMAAGWANWEYLFVRWAETAGIKLGYAVSQDLIDDPDVLSNASLYLSVGHDEYWTAEMRDSVENFVERGGNAAFFSGNVSFWRARLEHDKLVCYKMKPNEDPFAGSSLTSTMWSDPVVGRPENSLTGVSFTRGGYARMANSPQGSGGYQVQRPNHWIFEGTGLQRDDLIGADAIVVGYECDGCAVEKSTEGLTPTFVDGTPEGFEILAHAPARLWETKHIPEALREDYIGELNWVADRLMGEDTAKTRAEFEEGYAIMGVFSKGDGHVFTVGCTDWAFGLCDPQVSQITNNVISKFSRR